ncbi:MAG: hypothetical protein O7B79_05075, partial [SAR324 cluster bacterium]|nr:hypothetical protein [SAR324 cluster bacterium]
SQVMDHWLEPRESRDYAEQFSGDGLRSQAECVYHKLLTESFSRPEVMLPNVARWSMNRMG